MSTPASCTISMMLAAEAPVGVIVRRGPTRWFQIIRWDATDDSFQDGQWFNGRLYAGQSHLSPDGMFFIYMAMNAHWGPSADCYLTAISRVPYLRPLVSWNAGPLNGGGGRFLSNCLAMTPAGLLALPRPGCRDAERPPDVAGTSINAPYGDPSPDGLWEIHHTATPKPGYRLRNVSDDSMTDLHGASSAGWDRGGRLVYTKRSSLFAARHDSGSWVHSQVADFNDERVPQPDPAPAWAAEW